MPTIAEMMQKFASAAPDNTSQAGVVPARQPAAAAGGDHTKIASGGGEPAMKTLFDIYSNIAGQDQVKTAAAAAHVPTENQAEIEADFAKMAEQIADAEAAEQVGGDDGEQDMIKVAQEYDSAGRIMARGFYDEFQKLAAGVTTTAPDNQNTESASTAKTPALGDRGLPTLETNFAGSTDHDESMKTTGTDAGKSNYADSLAPTKTISAGQGTGDDPEAGALAIGSGSPVGFATVRDLSA